MIRSMTNKLAIALFSGAVALAAEAGKAPTRIQIMPAGPDLEAADGRKWKLLDPEAVVQASSGHVDLMIDYEHASHLKAPNGERAEAAGWIKRLYVEEGAIFAEVEWTAQAEGDIASKAYRYLSPEFTVDKNDVVLSISAAALVNRPAFNMPALASAKQETSQMDLSAICKLLGIDEASDITAICSAIDKLNQDHSTALAAAKVGILETHVTKEAYTAIASERDSLKAALAKREEEDKEAAIASALDKAVEAGKVLPGSRDEYRALCSAEDGLERFSKLLKTLPVILDSKSQIDPGKKAPGSVDQRDGVALAAAAQKYVNEAAAEGRTISIAEAMEIVTAQS